MRTFIPLEPYDNQRAAPARACRRRRQLRNDRRRLAGSEYTRALARMSRRPPTRRRGDMFIHIVFVVFVRRQFVDR